MSHPKTRDGLEESQTWTADVNVLNAQQWTPDNEQYSTLSVLYWTDHTDVAERSPKDQTLHSSLEL
jgi:hypothetical protein